MFVYLSLSIKVGRQHNFLQIHKNINGKTIRNNKTRQEYCVLQLTHPLAVFSINTINTQNNCRKYNIIQFNSTLTSEYEYGIVYVYHSM